MRLLATLMIVISFLGLTTYGLLFIYSSTASPENEAFQIFSLSISKHLQKQLIFYAIGLAVLVFAMRSS